MRGLTKEERIVLSTRNRGQVEYHPELEAAIIQLAKDGRIKILYHDGRDYTCVMTELGKLALRLSLEEDNG